MRVLIVSNDSYVPECFKQEFHNAFVIDVIKNGEDGAYKSFENFYDIVIVDTFLPDLNGFEVCRMIRGLDVCSPVLLLIPENSVEKRVEALNCGADACLQKPFSLLEFTAGVTSLLRRNSGHYCQDRMVAHDLSLDTAKRTVERNNQPIYLRRKEFDLLEYLIRHKGDVVSKEDLLDHIWDKGLDVLSNTVEVHIKSLRDKIDKDYDIKLIKTIHGLGYKVDDK
jgi:two-component system, OmpR family, copper resistance phosphate regulon response regulator CusR